MPACRRGRLPPACPSELTGRSNCSYHTTASRLHGNGSKGCPGHALGVVARLPSRGRASPPGGDAPGRRADRLPAGGGARALLPALAVRRELATASDRAAPRAGGPAARIAREPPLRSPDRAFGHRRRPPGRRWAARGPLRSCPRGDPPGPSVAPTLVLFAPTRSCELLERSGVDLVGPDLDDFRRGDGPEGRGAFSTLHNGPLTEDRAGADLGDGLAVDLGGEHSVDDEIELVACLALLDERFVDLESSRLRRRPLAHDRARELTFQRGLDLGHERRRVLVAPRRVLAERLAVPLVEVDHPRLLNELVLPVVDPVPREGTGPDQLVF